MTSHRDQAPAETAEARRQPSIPARVRSLVRAIEESDEGKIEEAVLRLSRSRRVFAPLAFAVGAFALLFDGLRLLVSNWRLTLVQILPALWIWVAMADLKVHVLQDNSFNVLRGPVLIPIILLIIAITAARLFPQRGVRRRRRTAARASDDSGDPLGKPLVRPLAGDRHRRDDGLLRRRPRAPDRGQAGLLEARQAGDDNGRRRIGRDGLHTALPARPLGPPDARIESPADPRDRPHRPRGHAAGEDRQPW